MCVCLYIIVCVCVSVYTIQCVCVSLCVYYPMCVCVLRDVFECVPQLIAQILYVSPLSLVDRMTSQVDVIYC